MADTPRITVPIEDLAPKAEPVKVDPCASHKVHGIHLDPCCPYCPDPEAPKVEQEPVAWLLVNGNANSEVITREHPGEWPNAHVYPLYRHPAKPEAPKVEQEPVAWRPVVGFEDAYEVSSEGDIRNTKTGRIQSKNLMGQGYVKADLWKNGSRTQTSVHRVVAEAFLPRVTGDTEVNHIDGDKKNNRVSNLEWSDRRRNTDHSRYVLGNDVKPVLAIDPASGAEEYFPSIEQAGRSGYSASGIYDALNGRKKTHGGKKWTYTAWRQPTHPAPASDELLEALEQLVGDYESEGVTGPLMNCLRDLIAKHKGPQS